MIPERADFRGPVDWWPFTRIIVTAAALGLAAHVLLNIHSIIEHLDEFKVVKDVLFRKKRRKNIRPG